MMKFRTILLPGIILVGVGAALLTSPVSPLRSRETPTPVPTIEHRETLFSDSAEIDELPAPNSQPSAQSDSVKIRSLTLNPERFTTAGTSDGGLETGDTPDARNEPVIMHSQFFSAEIPFNVVVPRWRADTPTGTRVAIAIRTAPARDAGSSEPIEWSDWYNVAENSDLTLPEDLETTGEFITATSPSGLDQNVEAIVTLYPSWNGKMPTFHSLSFTFLDSTAPPPWGDEAALSGRAEEETDALEGSGTQSYSKPNVVPRSQWCWSSDCTYSGGLYYEPVTHLIIHHTVSSNTNTDWKANVRAIWAYHTYTRKWGDIGYNYLVDPNGVIYEGHLGGDDVIGTHAADANRGGMGVALLGTFSTSTPPEPMVNSLVELFAWKADQRSIDLFDASRLPLLDWGLLHLIGHRDVYGTTACPGGIAHSMIDDIRDRINVKLNYDSEYSYVDEGSAEVSFANANWHNAPYACGFNSHSQFTFSTDDPSESANWGEYRPQIPETGTYEVQVYVPRCNTGEPDTRKATYVINHLNGTDTVVVNQSANLGLWVSLGEYDLGQGNGGSIRLGDLVNGEHWRAIWYDAIRFTSREISSLTNATPQANSWQHDRSVTFTWDTAFKTNMSSLQLLVSTTSDFSNLIVEQSLSAAQTNYTHKFNADYPHLYWQLKAITSNSGVVYSAPSHFSLDATAPSANITSGEQIEWNYAVTWQGSDTLSGLSGYKLEYRETGASSWTLYKSYNASTNSATFVPPKIGISTTYQLRIRASDQAGNLQAGSANGDISTVNIPSWDFDHLYLSVIERP